VTALVAVVIPVLVGAILAVVPWTTWWEANYLLQPHPVLRPIVLSLFTRGAVSGVGLVNILLAIHDARSLLLTPREPN
jgi:hypothetical protein